MADQLPCGCWMDVVEDKFVYQPCSPNCEYWLYVQRQWATQRKPVEFVIDPSIPESTATAIQADFWRRQRSARRQRRVE